jgi:hypothetical protein
MFLALMFVDPMALRNALDATVDVTLRQYRPAAEGS